MMSLSKALAFAFLLTIGYAFLLFGGLFWIMDSYWDFSMRVEAEYGNTIQRIVWYTPPFILFFVAVTWILYGSGVFSNED